MNIFFQTHNIELGEHEKHIMSRRIEGLHKFFSPNAHVYIDVERTRVDQHGEDLYRVSIRIEDAQLHYYTEDFQDTIQNSFNHAYGDMFHMVRNDRSRSRTLARKAGKRIKNFFKRSHK